MERWLFNNDLYRKIPLIKPGSIEYREYQIRIAAEASKRNTLVVLPTGLGKTVIAALVIAKRLSLFRHGKCIFLAPTKPLATQHMETLRRILNIDPREVITLTGSQPPRRRAELWHNARVICMTPQTLKNDIVAGRYDLKDVVLLVFDEAHRAIGNYPYTFIADSYMRTSIAPLILALTASPGSEKEKILEICHNLHIKWIEYRTEDSPDVRPYLQSIITDWVIVKLPEDFKRAIEILSSELKGYLEDFKEKGYINSLSKVRLKDILEAKALIQERLKEHSSPPRDLLEDLAKLVFVARIIHALDLLETQGFHALGKYLLKLKELAQRRSSNRFLKEFVNSGKWIKLWKLVNENRVFPHPKISELLNILRKELTPGSKAIIFTNYRDTVNLIVEILKKHKFRAIGFIGQTSRNGVKGLSQKEQEKIMKLFKEGYYEILVATQIAEEGIDVAECDLVIFYDNVPSAIRFIQRRGRTGRRRAGKVIILIAKGTRDETYYWASLHRRRKMRETLRKLRLLLKDLQKGKQQTLLEDLKGKSSGISSHHPNITIIIDNRELSSKVAEELSKLGVQLIARNLEVADYIISDEIAVERKSINDFVRSIMDLRLFKQAKLLRKSYQHPLIIIEGHNLATSMRQEALVGAILSLMIDFGIPVLWTDNSSETARYLYLLAKREQLEKRRVPRIKGERPPLTMDEILLEMLASIPGINRVLAERLLRYFGTLRQVANASIHELMSVEGIGQKLAETIRKVFTTRYGLRST